MDAHRYISTATTTDVFNGPGTLKSIILGETAAGAITVSDTSGSNVIAVLKASITEGVYDFGDKGISLSLGLRIVTAGASKLTVVFNRG